MHIAHLSGTFSGYSGIDRVVSLLAEQQIAEGHTVTIMALQGDMQPPPGARYISLGLKGGLLYQRIYRLCMGLDRRTIVAAAKQLQSCDVIYSHQYPMNEIALQVKRMYGRRYVYYNHGIPPNSAFRSILERVYITMFRSLTHRSLRFADEIISISHYLQNVLTSETGRSSMVIHDHADQRRFHPNVSPKDIRQKLGIGDDPMIFFLGRLSPHKAIEELLTAVQLARKENRSLHLVIAGKPTFKSYFRYLQQMADDHVHFVGYVPDEVVPHYYAASTAYATTSHWEGFDLPVVEAQAIGKPVVAYNIGPHAEIISDDGILVPPYDTVAFSKALLQICKKSGTL